MLRSLLILIAGLLLTANGYAQGIVIKHLTKEDGLPSNKIYNISNDSKGYLWICSDKGLARYNGRTFETFTTSNGLPDNEIFSAREDFEHRLWITSFKSVLCYLQNGVFHTAANTPWLNFPLKSPNYSNRPRIEKDSSLIIMGNDGNSFLHIKHNHIRVISLPKGLSIDREMPKPFWVVKYGPHYFKAVYHTKSVVVDSNGATVEILPNKKNCTYFAVTAPNAEYLYSNYGVEDPEGEIIKNTNKMPADFKKITTLCFLRTSSNMFLGSENGLFLADNTPVIKNMQFSSLIEDRDGNIWACTINNGIFRIHKNYLDIKNDSIGFNVFIAKKTKDALYFISEDGNFYKMLNGKAIKLYDNPRREYSNYLDKSRTFISNAGNAAIISRAVNIGFNLKTIDAVPNIYIGHNTLGGKYSERPIIWDNPFTTNASIKNLFEFDSSIYVSTISTLFSIKMADIALGKTTHRTILIDAKTDQDARIYDRAIHLTDSSLWFARADGVHILKNGVIKERKELSTYIFRQFKLFKNYFIGFTDQNKLLIDNISSAQVKLIPNEDDCIWENIYPIDDNRAIINTNNYYRMLNFFYLLMPTEHRAIV